MEAIIFAGVQASGKSTFYQKNFFRTHLRISMDMLNTRNKEEKFLETCFLLHQRFVIDNTNPTRADRARYIQAAKAYKYKVIGYYFSTVLEEAIYRNAKRRGKELIPEKGIRATNKKLEVPAPGEGFDELYCVRLINGIFSVEQWPSSSSSNT